MGAFHCRQASRQAKLDQTISRLRAVLPPEVAQHLPPSDAMPVLGQRLGALSPAVANAQKDPVPAFAVRVLSSAQAEDQFLRWRPMCIHALLLMTHLVVVMSEAACCLG